MSEYNVVTILHRSLLKKILESRLFVGRNRLGDCHLQENTMGIFWEEAVKDLTLSLLRVINVKIPLQPHKKYDITQYGELDFS